MKNHLLLLVSIIICSNTFGQSKKQQIETLTTTVDSLQLVLDIERERALKIIMTCNEQIKSLETEMQVSKAKYEWRTERYEKEIFELERTLDSLRKKYNIATQEINLDEIVAVDTILTKLNKEDVLTESIGTYKLVSISGSLGANTMFETYKEGGRWKSSSSNITDGNRETTPIKLINKDIVLLNDLRLVVLPNLNVKIESGRNLLYEIPFNENGMDFQVKEDPNGYFSAFNPSTTFVDDKLILSVNDHIDFSKVITGNFDVIAADHMQLRYSVEHDIFYLDIFQGVCCDTNTLVFMKN